MAYSKQNFQDGQILNAANLETMENGIIAGQGARNLLVNSDFRNPVNTNGQTSYTGAVEGIDKWVGGTSDSKVYINTAKSVAFYTNTVGNLAYFRQYINIPASHLYGKTFTLALEDASGAIFAGTGTYLTENPSSTKSIIWITMAADRTFVLYMKTDGNAFVQLSTKDNTTTIHWAALYEGSYTVDTLPSYVPKPIQQEMLDCGVPLAPHNLLDNSDFRNPVNQRGASAYGGSYYGIDRWYGNTPNQELQVRASDIAVFAGSAAFCGIRQKVGRMASLAGKTVTFAVQVYSNVSPRIAFLDASNNSLAQKDGMAATNQTLILTYTVPSDATADSVVPIIVARTQAAGDYIGIYWAALYEGSYDASTLPAYQPKGYAAELAECQRYYRTMGYPVIPCANNPAGTQVYGFLPFRMRIDNPTVSCDTLYYFKGDTTFYTVSSASAASYGTGTRIVFNLSSNVEGNLAGAVAGNGITLSADL